MIRIEIETGNAAFADDFEHEVELVLGRAYNKIVHNLPLENGDKLKIMDSNGNSVGFVEWIED